uniref:Ribosomal protein S7 n=1 Tax=Balamuthia mandrillaris TaxID=66527 RepID=A0A0K1HRV9_9EUKA|nr:ribosomal protein S7 [Balamuthia mandrillaris]AKT94918.1 ribosomal protein S7 [Balamuthia mandrillaris]
MRSVYVFNGFLHHNLQKGFGLRAFNLLLHVFSLLKRYFRISPLRLVFSILETNRPRVSFRISRFRPRISYAPYVLYAVNSFKHCFRWIFKASRERQGLTKRLQLFTELSACFFGKSKVVSLRTETHLLANKYIRNLWRRSSRTRTRRLRLKDLDFSTLKLSKRMKLFLIAVRKLCEKSKRAGRFRRTVRSKRRQTRLVTSKVFHRKRVMTSVNKQGRRFRRLNLRIASALTRGFLRSHSFSSKGLSPFLIKNERDFGLIRWSFRRRFFRKSIAYIRPSRRQFVRNFVNSSRYTKGWSSGWKAVISSGLYHNLFARRMTALAVSRLIRIACNPKRYDRSRYKLYRQFITLRLWFMFKRLNVISLEKKII